MPRISFMFPFWISVFPGYKGQGLGWPVRDQIRLRIITLTYSGYQCFLDIRDKVRVANQGPDQTQDNHLDHFWISVFPGYKGQSLGWPIRDQMRPRISFTFPFWISVFPGYKEQGFRVGDQGPDQAQDQLHVPILDISVSWI
jgi:hypothetical protein